jgi:cytidine deaminase
MTLSPQLQQHLIEQALLARQRAYAPYSRFLVGAALLLKDQTIIPGCNVENASYGMTICAERTAITAAIALGRRDFLAMAVVGDTPEPITPCGACRQFLFEFDPAMILILSNLLGHKKLVTVQELLPGGFGPQSLGQSRSDPDQKTDG